MAIDDVRFRKEVPEDVRNAVLDYMRGKALCEAETGVAAPLDGLHGYLSKREFRMVVHAYGIEIVPLSDWIKEEVHTFSDMESRDILRKHLEGCGVPTERLDELFAEVDK